jgi:DNA-binding NarL/FixJ family response regulator
MNGTRVLIAEDDWTSAEAVRIELENLGHQVVGKACTGTEAVRLAALERPDVVLVGPGVAGQDGAAAAVRLIRQVHGIPVVCLEAGAPLALCATAAPPFGRIHRPFTPQALQAAIASALAGPAAGDASPPAAGVERGQGD